MSRYERIETDKFKKIKAEIKKRDKYTCQLCGKKSRRLHVHHIHTYAKNEYLMYSPLNLISLDYTCHKKVTKNEEYYVPLLARKAKENARDYFAAKRIRDGDSGGHKSEN